MVNSISNRRRLRLVLSTLVFPSVLLFFILPCGYSFVAVGVSSGPAETRGHDFQGIQNIEICISTKLELKRILYALITVKTIVSII